MQPSIPLDGSRWRRSRKSRHAGRSGWPSFAGPAGLIDGKARRAGLRTTYLWSVLVALLLCGLIMPQNADGFWPVDFFLHKPAPAALPEPVPDKLMVPLVEDQAGLLEQKIAQMAEDLFVNLQEPDPENGVLGEGLMVCTFVDLQKLSRTSSFGRYVAEQLMGEFQRHHYTVVDLRKSSSVIVQEKRGEYGLSRDPEEIGNQVAAGAMLTGTYTVAGNHIMVNARILDNRDASLLSSSTFVFRKNELAEILLADSRSSSKMKSGGQMYMKKLEL